MKKSVRKIMSVLLSTSILMGIGLCEAIPFTHTSIRVDAATEKNGVTILEVNETKEFYVTPKYGTATKGTWQILGENRGCIEFVWKKNDSCCIRAKYKGSAEVNGVIESGYTQKSLGYSLP